METDSDLAEVTGTLIGDGCLSKYFIKTENRFRYEIAFTGNNDEFSYYSDFVQPVFQKHFGTKGRLFIRKDHSTRFHCLSKSAFDFFCNLGIPIGEKSHTVSIPKPFFEGRDWLIPCLRGIWDTDGSIYQRYSRKYSNHAKHYSGLKVLQLKSASNALIEDVKKGLGFLSIKSNRITKQQNAFVLRITDQNEIARFLKLVGFRNSHHLRRIAVMPSVSL